MMLLEMPDHILTRVFNLLEIKDRLNLTLVCRKLNHLFGNEKALMKNILVSYQHLSRNKIKYYRFLNTLVSSGRKYRNLFIYFGKNIFTVINFIEDLLPLTKLESLTELEIWEIQIELEDLALLVNNLPKNLEVFKTNCVDLKNTKNSTEKLVCNKLKKIYTRTEIFLQMMETPDLIDLTVYHYGSPIRDVELEELRKKIVSLEKLKSLKVNVPMFNEDFAQNAKFKLTEVSVIHEDWVNTLKFLKFQTELQKVKLDFYKEKKPRSVRLNLESVWMLPKLKDLELCTLDFFDRTGDQNFNVSANTSIETFSLVQSYFPAKSINKLIPKLPNLKHLNLIAGCGFFGDELVILNTLQHLKKLEMWASDCVLPHLNLPKLEDFSFSYPTDNFDSEDEVKCDDEYLQKFFENHRNLKKVEIPGLISDKLWKFMKNNLHCLEYLKICFNPYHTYLGNYDHFYSDAVFDMKVDDSDGIITATKRIRFNCLEN